MPNSNDNIYQTLRDKGFVQLKDGSWSKPDKPRNPGLGSAVPSERKLPLAKEDDSKASSVGASEPRYRITVTMHRDGKLLDTDNKWIAPKAVLDGLVTAFELPGDSESQIDYRVEQMRAKGTERHKNGNRY